MFKNAYFRWMPLLLLTAAGVFGCASPPARNAMVFNGIPETKGHPYTVSVATQGGSETGVFDLPSISNPDLAAAIEESITKTGVFSRVVRAPGADYELTVAIVDLSRPVAGFETLVDMEAAWSLSQTKTGNVLMRRSIKSSARATPGDAFSFVNRVGVAVERAARENIRQGLLAIGKLDLN